MSHLSSKRLDVPKNVESGEFFSIGGKGTLVGREDLERLVPDEEKGYLEPAEDGFYWLIPEYAYAAIYRSRREDELKYYVVEPYISKSEQELIDYLDAQLTEEIDIESIDLDPGADQFAEIIQRTLYKLLRRYDYAPKSVFEEGGRARPPVGDESRAIADEEAAGEAVKESSDISDDTSGMVGKFASKLVKVASGQFEKGLEDSTNGEKPPEHEESSGGEENEVGEGDEEERVEAPDPSGRVTDSQRVLREGDLDITELNARQVDKITYYFVRNYVNMGKIDPLLRDVNVEDISCDGWGVPVYVAHEDYGDVRTNVVYEKDELDSAVKQMAQADGKGISMRQPMVDATLPTGERAQLTLSDEVSERGSNFTIRTLKDVPFTPIDLINWETYSLHQMVYLWLCVQFGRKIMFAGGTASGKTTTLNALSLFIPKTDKIITIEDTPELKLPQDNKVQSTTREQESGTGVENIDEFDLMEAGLRQNPKYLVMGEVRGEEGRTLFQIMNSGHTAFTTFHADSIEGVINRFTSEPINVAQAQFDELDVICVQKQTRVNGREVRRSQNVIEVGRYDKEGDYIQREQAYQWDPASDQIKWQHDSPIAGVLEDIRIENGWTEERFHEEFENRRLLLSYLVRHGINDYSMVAGVIQAYMTDPESVLYLLATGELGQYIDNLRQLDSLNFDVDKKEEAKVKKPEPSDGLLGRTNEILREQSPRLEPYLSRDLGSKFGEPDPDTHIETRAIAGRGSLGDDYSRTSTAQPDDLSAIGGAREAIGQVEEGVESDTEEPATEDGTDDEDDEAAVAAQSDAEQVQSGSNGESLGADSSKGDGWADVLSETDDDSQAGDTAGDENEPTPAIRRITDEEDDNEADGEVQDKGDDVEEELSAEAEFEGDDGDAGAGSEGDDVTAGEEVLSGADDGADNDELTAAIKHVDESSSDNEFRSAVAGDAQINEAGENADESDEQVEETDDVSVADEEEDGTLAVPSNEDGGQTAADESGDETDESGGEDAEGPRIADDGDWGLSSIESEGNQETGDHGQEGEVASGESEGVGEVEADGVEQQDGGHGEEVSSGWEDVEIEEGEEVDELLDPEEASPAPTSPEMPESPESPEPVENEPDADTTEEVSSESVHAEEQDESGESDRSGEDEAESDNGDGGGRYDPDEIAEAFESAGVASTNGDGEGDASVSEEDTDVGESGAGMGRDLRFRYTGKLDPEEVDLSDVTVDPGGCLTIVTRGGEVRQCDTPPGDKPTCHFHEDKPLLDELLEDDG